MPSANILIRNVTAVLTADDDAAGVAMGSEMSGGIFNVTIEDCVFGTEQFASGVYIKSTNRHTSLARHGEASDPGLCAQARPQEAGTFTTSSRAGSSWAISARSTPARAAMRWRA